MKTEVIFMTKIYYNGNIKTMDDNSRETCAIVVENGVIIFVGKDEDALKYDGEKIDLQGNYMLPGFIDGHSHVGHVSSQFSLE